MLIRRLKLLALVMSCAIALCACESLPQVGAVVEAPQVEPPPPPAIVLQTPARPTGYWRQRILDGLQKQ